MTKAKKRVRAKTGSQPVISPTMIVLVVVAAVLVVGGLILLGSQSQSSSSGGGAGSVDVSQFPAKGDANAPVTLIEFSDYG